MNVALIQNRESPAWFPHIPRPIGGMFGNRKLDCHDRHSVTRCLGLHNAPTELNLMALWLIGSCLPMGKIKVGIDPLKHLRREDLVGDAGARECKQYTGSANHAPHRPPLTLSAFPAQPVMGARSLRGSESFLSQ